MTSGGIRADGRDAGLASGGSPGRPRRILPLHALRMAVRGLRRTPGIALTGVLTLGIGLTAAVILLGVWLGSIRPLPVPEGHEIVRLRATDARANPVPAAALPDGALAALGAARGLDGVSAWAPAGGTLVAPGGPAVRVSAAAMTPGTFALLGVPALRGRHPTDAAEDRDAILLGAELWRDELGGDPSVIGTSVRLDGRPFTVIGIMPADFGFPTNHDAWTVLDPAAGTTPATAEFLARLADGATPDDVGPALEAALASLPVAADAQGPYRVRVEPWVGGRSEGGEVLALGALGVLVGLLLLVCAANVSTLLLVRATERVRTLAVHSALGAGRAQVVLQLLLEALLVALVGGALGLAAGRLGLGWIETNLSSHWGYYWMRMELRPGVILGTLAAVVGTAVAAGTAPALLAIRADLRSVMGNRSGAGRGRRRTERWFVDAQVALSTTALVAAVIMARGLAGSERLAGGLPLDEIVVATVSPPAERFPDAGARVALARELRDAVAAIPDVRGAAVSSGIPGYETRPAAVEVEGRVASPGAGSGDPVDAVGRSGADPAGRLRSYWSAVDERVDDVYGLALVAGRGIEATDDPGAPPVVVVNRAFAGRFLGGTEAVGARVRVEGIHDEEGWATVVGVVEDHHEERPGLRADRVFVPLAQTASPGLFLSARASSADPQAVATVVSSLREAVASVDPALAVEGAGTLDARLAWLMRMPRTMAGFGALGGLAGVLVAAIGLYGAVAFRVRSGLREVGVRMALGAPAAGILRRIVADTVKGVLPAVGVGLAVAFVVAPALAIFSFGYRPRSAWGFAAAGTIMAAVAVAASLGPGLRAARLDPNEVLRTE